MLNPVVTAKKFIEYKKARGHISIDETPPKVLVCYQQSTFDYLLGKHLNLQPATSFSDLYLLDEGRLGVLGYFGIGAPALANKMEQLIALGTKQFIAVGTTGTLQGAHPIGDFVLAPKALAEDGVAHLYLPKEQPFAIANPTLCDAWHAFTKKQNLPEFHSASTWSFSAIFRETPADIIRVVQKGCSIVEMEAATLYAIGQEKGVQALSLFVVSDNLTPEEWFPHIKEKKVQDRLHQLADLGLEFCRQP